MGGTTAGRLAVGGCRDLFWVCVSLLQAWKTFSSICWEGRQLRALHGQPSTVSPLQVWTKLKRVALSTPCLLSGDTHPLTSRCGGEEALPLCLNSGAL